MAKDKELTESGGRPLEDLQREILEVELQTKKLQLSEAKKRNEDFTQREEQRHRHNRQRMSELQAGRNGHLAIIKKCRHKSGGNPKNVLRGGGIGSFSIISRSIMPDGVTLFLQCPRCRLKLYFRPLPEVEERRLKQADSKTYEIYEFGKKLYEQSVETGLENAELRGPTFFFQNEEGVPIIPGKPAEMILGTGQ